MEEAMEKNEAWDVAKRGEKVDVPDEAFAKIRDRMLGAYFGIVGEILDSGISNVADLEMGVQTALVTKPPFEYMNEVGIPASRELVEQYAADHKGFPVPECIATRNDPWEIPLVICDQADGVAVLTIRRPAVLNALNKEVFEQLGARVQEAEADESIEGIVITGFGRKAFVSGADIGMLAAVQSPADGEATSAHSHSYLNLIENCSKPVVCAYNGLAFGGGNELALACHKRIARTGLRVLAGQPEPNLGIIPGAGGTQRLPRVIGFEKAWTILRTGGVVSGRDAVDCGLISAEIDGDLRAEAIRLAKQMAEDGFERINADPITVPVDTPDVDLGHLSTAVDEIMRKAIVEGLAEVRVEVLRRGLRPRGHAHRHGELHEERPAREGGVQESVASIEEASASCSRMPTASSSSASGSPAPGTCRRAGWKMGSGPGRGPSANSRRRPARATRRCWPSTPTGCATRSRGSGGRRRGRTATAARSRSGSCCASTAATTS
jgi:enoyl-CoA hydratase/carnithine racemase